jgi:hypothetical protein
MINTTELMQPALDKITRITPNRRAWPTLLSLL